MKKITIILLMCLSFAVARSQVAFNHTASNPTGAILNTNVDTLNYHLTRGYPSIAIQPYVTKSSGTQAGTAILACSSTGVAGTWTNTDTLTLTNVTPNVPVIWVKTIPVKYWRIIRSGGTTVAGLNNAYITPSY